MGGSLFLSCTALADRERQERIIELEEERDDLAEKYDDLRFQVLALEKQGADPEVIDRFLETLTEYQEALKEKDEELIDAKVAAKRDGAGNIMGMAGEILGIAGLGGAGLALRRAGKVVKGPSRSAAQVGVLQRQADQYRERLEELEIKVFGNINRLPPVPPPVGYTLLREDHTGPLPPEL